MPVISEVVHPLSLNFANQRKVVCRRTVNDESWETIASKVVNLQGAHPSRELVRRVYNDFAMAKGRRVYRYSKCGRKPWTVTPEIEAYLLRRLVTLRKECVCTATTLQREVARDHFVALATSTIRKVLVRRGYRWLPRAQKRKYTRALLRERLAFARSVLALSAQRLRERLALSLDGVVLSMPPKDRVDRRNLCFHGESHIWRKRSEAASPQLAGDDPFAAQVPLSRALPMWGGISEGGFAEVVCHQNKKLTTQEWVRVVDGGKLDGAIRTLQPALPAGPWHVLCDNERFLDAPDSQAAYRRCAVRLRLWHVPAHSPDLNPVEKFWAWLRKQLRLRDLQDLRFGMPPLDRTAYRARVRALCRTARAQRVAASCAKGLKKTCKEVVLKKGAAARS